MSSSSSSQPNAIAGDQHPSHKKPKTDHDGSVPAPPQSQPAQPQPNEETVSDLLEERLIDAEYKIWKKNTPYLYDLVMTHSLEWPSLTCQWLPSIKTQAQTEEHSLLLGTHTNGDQNYLMVASVILPKNDTPPVDAEAAPNASASTTTPALLPPANYDDERGEIGGFGYQPVTSSNSPASTGKIEIRLKVKHEGEINRARYMPQNHFWIATRGPDPEIYVFDLSKHPSFPPENSDFCPQCTLVGHEKEGYGLNWSPLRAGLLASGSEDGSVRLWDVNKGMAAGSSGKLAPESVFYGHGDVVEDVAFHCKDENLMGSVGDDRRICLWDVRKPCTDGQRNTAVQVVTDAHDGDINSIAFNPVNEFLFATGSADKTVALWDIRNLKSRMHTLESHTDQVFQVSWAPFNETILASCGADRRVNVWDLSRIGAEQTPEDAEDGPPELLFMHGGHTSKVSDFSWNRNDEWTMASVSEDNVMQVWNMAEEIYADEEDEMEEEDLEDEQVLEEED